MKKSLDDVKRSQRAFDAWRKENLVLAPKITKASSRIQSGKRPEQPSMELLKE